MHVALPIRSIIPSLEGPVLAVLAGTTAPLTGRRIAALAGASHTATTAALRRLEQAGVVIASAHGPSVLYVANRDHLAWPAVEALVGLRTAALKLLRETIENWAVQPQSVTVFGSFARADGTDTSDIDLLLVRPDDLPTSASGVWQEQLSALSERIQRATGNSAQLLDEDGLKLSRRLNAKDPIIDNWLEDGLHLAGASLRQVLDDAVRKYSA